MKTDNNHSQVGFTLIEMLIVTAVFGVLATVTVPNLLSSRVAANESTVVATLRAISSIHGPMCSSRTRASTPPCSMIRRSKKRIPSWWSAAKS